MKLSMSRSDKDSKIVTKIRKEFGLQPIRKGNRRCLKCDRNFNSPDLANQKMCRVCRDER